MKDILISNCEKQYVIKCLDDFTRVDGRAFGEFRELKIEFGRDWGCCHVSLGETRVLAQVSCEIQQPKPSRPHEGLLNINVELSPMGAPNFEAGRQSELSVHLNRILEKCIKDSRAVDLESLCIKLNEKVWALRVDVNILNHEGNILDCASIAALTALTHFKRPDVTSDGENIVIHTYEQRDPIPTAIHHYPVCVSYASFKQGAVSIADPTLLEEGVSEAQLVYAVNAFKEICSVHLGGSALANANLIIECASKAASRAFIVVQNIKEAIEKDKENRLQNKTQLFENFITSNIDIDLSREQLSLCLNKWSIKENTKKKNQKKKRNEPIQMDVDSAEKIVSIGEGSAELVTATIEDQENMNEDSEDSDVLVVETKPKQIEPIEIPDSGDSEEERVVILNADASTTSQVKAPRNKKQRKRFNKT